MSARKKAPSIKPYSVEDLTAVEKHTISCRQNVQDKLSIESVSECVCNPTVKASLALYLTPRHDLGPRWASSQDLSVPNGECTSRLFSARLHLKAEQFLNRTTAPPSPTCGVLGKRPSRHARGVLAGVESIEAGWSKG